MWREIRFSPRVIDAVEISRRDRSKISRSDGLKELFHPLAKTAEENNRSLTLFWRDASGLVTQPEICIRRLAEVYTPALDRGEICGCWCAACTSNIVSRHRPRDDFKSFSRAHGLSLSPASARHVAREFFSQIQRYARVETRENGGGAGATRRD